MVGNAADLDRLRRVGMAENHLHPLAALDQLPRHLDLERADLRNDKITDLAAIDEYGQTLCRQFVLPDERTDLQHHRIIPGNIRPREFEGTFLTFGPAVARLRIVPT